MSSDFNQFVELENGKPVIDMEEAYIMYVALTRAQEKLILSPAWRGSYLRFRSCESGARKEARSTRC
jgi:superfamily I DNA/RNA helicase